MTSERCDESLFVLLAGDTTLSPPYGGQFLVLEDRLQQIATA